MPDTGFAKVESGERRNRSLLKFGGRRRRASAVSSNSVIVYLPGQRSGYSIDDGSTTTHPSSGSRFSFITRSAVGSDHGSPTSHHLAVLGRCSGGPDRDPDQEKGDAIVSSPHRSPIGPVGKVEQASQEVEVEKPGRSKGAEHASLIKRKHSFSHALRECQIRRHKFEVLPFEGKKLRRQRPASLELNSHGTNVAILSPRFLSGGIECVMKSSATSSHCKSEAFPSPDTPNCLHGTGRVASHKGWSSERAPPPANYSQRYMGVGPYLPFNNGRVLPSKWEDAEKWIFSPVSTDGIGGSSLPPSHDRRPKSKSGPLVPPGYSPASPVASCFDSGRVGNFIGTSPFLAGALLTEHGFVDNRRVGTVGGEGARSSSANAETYILRSASIHECSKNLLESSPSIENSQTEKFECLSEGTKSTSMVVLRKDAAVQISPEGSFPSSPKHRPSFLPSPLVVNTIEELESHFPKLDVRDVQVDDQVAVTRWTKKQVARRSDEWSINITEGKRKAVEAKPSGFKVSRKAKCLSKSKREEAKICAWENLQEAKAEAAIRKLEMKLEKRRTSSMDKILKRLRSAQKRAEEMRSAVAAAQTHELAKSTKKVSCCRKTGQRSSCSGCFTCHAF